MHAIRTGYALCKIKKNWSEICVYLEKAFNKRGSRAVSMEAGEATQPAQEPSQVIVTGALVPGFCCEG
jgi:hypothetical protein